MENGGHGYYARRAEVTYCNIYFKPGMESPRPHIDGLFVFCNNSSLDAFTRKVSKRALPNGICFGRFVLSQLLQLILENGANFLQAISLEIHNAVGLPFNISMACG